MKRFEQRFEGPDNAGLRKLVREAVAEQPDAASRRRAVLSLARTVALTASGTHTLELVAADYADAAAEDVI